MAEFPSIGRNLMCAAALALVASGCTTMPKPVASVDYCRFEMYRAEVELPKDTTLYSLQAGRPANALLLLSGGSLHGAFGAGLLTRWKELNDGLPRFRTVTGISTGALLSTHAFIGRPEAAQQAYTISDESQLLKPYARRGRNGEFGVTDYVSILKNNAVADLSPLRAQLHRYITMDVLQEVVDQSAGRQLLVGVVDVDSGDAVVFDMVAMARKAVENRDGRGEHFRNCYIDALVASASVPLAAKPVIIDNRLYMDGGARFGVFVDRLSNAAGLSGHKQPGDPPQLFIVINGKQSVEPQCGKADPARGCKDSKDDYQNLDGAHGGWNLLGLARRASDILIAQIDAFSTADIIARYKETYNGTNSGQNIHYYHIDADTMLKHPFAGSNCGAIHDAEDKRLRPLQFYPQYMACLIDYGRSYADAHAAELKIGHPPPLIRLPQLPDD